VVARARLWAASEGRRVMTEFILLPVDDEPNVLRALARDLGGPNWRVLTAQSGAEGLDRLADNEVDLVISDQRMPGMSGLEFPGQVKADYPDVLTTLLTAYAVMDVAMDAINQVDVHHFIVKPWDSERLNTDGEEGALTGEAACSGVRGHEDARHRRGRDSPADLENRPLRQDRHYDGLQAYSEVNP
jgi:DNA-binding NtrC family response regulator